VRSLDQSPSCPGLPACFAKRFRDFNVKPTNGRLVWRRPGCRQKHNMTTRPKVFKGEASVSGHASAPPPRPELHLVCAGLVPRARGTGRRPTNQHCSFPRVPVHRCPGKCDEQGHGQSWNFPFLSEQGSIRADGNGHTDPRSELTPAPLLGERTFEVTSPAARGCSFSPSCLDTKRIERQSGVLSGHVGDRSGKA